MKTIGGTENHQIRHVFDSVDYRQENAELSNVGVARIVRSLRSQRIDFIDRHAAHQIGNLMATHANVIDDAFGFTDERTIEFASGQRWSNHADAHPLGDLIHNVGFTGA